MKKKKKFKGRVCPKCGTETHLARCPMCGTLLIKLKVKEE